MCSILCVFLCFALFVTLCMLRFPPGGEVAVREQAGRLYAGGLGGSDETRPRGDRQVSQGPQEGSQRGL